MDKNWYKSKAIWGGVFVILGGIYGLVTEDGAGSTAVVTVGLGLWGIGIRAAAN
jgi:hypothetical protein